MILAIRDDDINYFTRPRDLEEIYRPLFESGLPLNLAVIPRVDSREQEPYVDESERGQANLHDVGENSDLVDFIRRMDGIEVEGDRVLTHLFNCLNPAYVGWRWAVTGLLVFGIGVMLVLWACFLADYATTRQVYFTVALLHVLAEAPFLLRSL